MANKMVQVVISAKNKMAAGLSAAGASLEKFGASAAKVGKLVGTAFLSVAAGIFAIGKKAVTAFGVQEKAERRAEAAFRAYGEEVASNVEHVKRFAAAIQDETGKGDESTIALAARLKLLGVQTDALESATKATMALGMAGMGEEQAAKAVAAARLGNYEALTRYIPALKAANSETEKAAIYNEFVVRGYAALQDELNTATGRWGELQGRIGDAWEAIGAFIVRGLETTGTLADISKCVKTLTGDLEGMSKQPGMAAATWAIFFENIKYGFIKILDVAGIAVDGIMEALMLVPRLVTFQWKKIGSDVKSGLDVAEMHAREHADRMGEIARKQAEEMNKAGDAPAASGAETDAQRGMRQMREASKQQDLLVAESSAKAAEEQWNAWNESFDLQMAAQQKLADEAVKLADEKRKAEADAANQAAQDVIDEMERVQAKRKDLAGKTIKDVLDEQKAQAQAAKDQAKEARKAERLRKADDPRRGRHLGKQQKEWLAAFDAIAGAQAGLLPGQNAIDAAKQNLLAAQNMEKSLANIELEMAINNRQMKELMQRA